MSYEDRDGTIWMDGQFVPWRDARVHLLTHTLHYGVGVFEGIRAYETDRGTAIFRLDDHTRRLFDSAHILGMKIPYDADAINEACIEVVRRNDLLSAYIRPLAYYGSEGMGLHATTLSVHVGIAAWYWGAYLGDEALARGIRVKTSSFARAHINSVMSRAKAVANYVTSILATQEAAEDGYDEALLLDVSGLVAEGSGENVFVVKDGAIFTPQLLSALNGITRKTVISLARDEGLDVIERPITRDDLYIADEIFFTGTAAEVTPVREVDNRAIGSGERGPITARLQTRYLDVVSGRTPGYEDWLTVV